MLSERFPGADETLTSAVRRGIPHHMMSKLRLFDPNAVEETNFGLGGHVAAPTGQVVYPRKDRMLLLHYKWLGVQYLARRNAMMETTRRARDIEKNWSHHYRVPVAEIEAGLRSSLATSIDVIAAGEAAWRNHKKRRWWRHKKQPEQPA